jgi:hypothetical protein
MGLSDIATIEEIGGEDFLASLSRASIAVI